MVFAISLKGKECSECEEKELGWWSKDETENVEEISVTCNYCGHEYPKRVIRKDSDKSKREVAERIATV